MSSNDLNKLASVKSEEVKDIIERMPSKFGIMIAGFMLFLTVAMFGFGFAIKYPDVIKGEFTLNSSTTTVKLVSNASGPLEIVKKGKNSIVKTGEVIGFVQNAARVRDVFEIDSLLHKVNLSDVAAGKATLILPENLNLGELSEKYFSFLSSYLSLNSHLNDIFYSTQENILSKQAVSQLRTITAIKSDIRLAKSAYDLSLKSYLRDSLLFSNRVLTLAEFEKSKMSLLSNQRSFEALSNQLSTNEYQLQSARSDRQKTTIQKQTNLSEQKVKLSTAYYGLIESIKLWKIKYVFTAPIDGFLQYSNFWSKNDHIEPGQEVFTVIPSRKDNYAQVFLPEVGAGKVKIGQRAILKLNDYPYNEYGSVAGKVSEISLTTNQRVTANNQKEGLYLVKVDLPNGLTTNYGSRLDFKFGAKGSVDIVTAERRLITRFFDNLKYQANN